MTQQDAVYRMEDRFMRAAQRGSMTRKLLQALADKATRRWRLPPVRVRFSTHTKLVGRSFEDGEILLYGTTCRRAWGGRNAHVLMHELAHYITDRKHPEKDDHGPNFAAVARDLYDHYDVLPAECFDCLAKVYGVSVNDDIRAPARRRKR